MLETKHYCFNIIPKIPAVTESYFDPWAYFYGILSLGTQGAFLVFMEQAHKQGKIAPLDLMHCVTFNNVFLLIILDIFDDEARDSLIYFTSSGNWKLFNRFLNHMSFYVCICSRLLVLHRSFWAVVRWFLLLLGVVPMYVSHIGVEHSHSLHSRRCRSDSTGKFFALPRIRVCWTRHDAAQLVGHICWLNWRCRLSLRQSQRDSIGQDCVLVIRWNLVRCF